MILPPAGARFELADVSVRYPGVVAVAGATLSIEPGQAVALVGPSGAGKTTLLRLLNGTVRAESGTVRVDGKSLDDLAPAALARCRAGIGFIHQDLRLVPNVRVVRNVLAGRYGRQSFLRSLKSTLLPHRSELEAVHEILERVGIGEKLFERTDTLSGGQRQRVAIARALYQQPVALLADEPVSSVDPARARDAVELLTRISREEGLTLVVSLHDIRLAREYFPRLIGMRGGRIRFDREAGETTDEELERLYDLAADEMLAGGA